MFYRVLYRDLLFYAICFTKMKMIRGNESPALFLCPKTFVVAFIQTFQCSLNELFE